MNNLTLFIRQLKKGGVFSFVNIAGLSLGMMVALFIAQYVGFERGFNKFHRSADRIFRVLTANDQETYPYTAPGFAPLAQQQVSGIQSYCRVAEGQNLGQWGSRGNQHAG